MNAMNAEPKPGRTRTDSGIEAIGSVSETLANARNFCTAVSSFTSETGFQAINNLFEVIPQQEAVIRQRDENVQELNSKLSSQQNAHEIYSKKLLLEFEHRYDEWKEDKDELQSDIQELETTREEQDTEIKKLGQQLRDCEVKLADYEKEHTQMTKRLKEKDQQFVAIEARLQKSRDEANDCKKELKKSLDKVAALEKSLGDEENDHRILKEEATTVKERLKEFVQFSVKIKELDLPVVSAQLEALWVSAIKTIEKFFGGNLSEPLLQSDWSALHDNSVFKNQIPLPQSNSDIAKKMRVATIVGMFARLIDKFIFQPTYLSTEDSGLREVLRRQAMAEPKKERYTRGILLATLPKDQDEISKDVILYTVEDMLENVKVRVFLNPDALEAFKKALESLVAQFQEQWKTIQRGRQKLELSFSYSINIKHPWYVLDAPARIPEGVKRSGAHPFTGKAEDDTVVIPRVYLMGTGPQPDPITHGYVIGKAQLDAAAEEVRKDSSNGPFVQESSNRNRNRPARTITGDMTARRNNGSRFLD
ncbi:hypothetical protein BS50DRAFT_625878 [Corynespora cassiicola Philippines]|uniref:Uncharacterized protein n=1 Tax=Corynespora cassiicola Philippines TaxID=1448308 RepID=A0A2T2N5I1_CORCC|nr:hypothetical protein BS50DRAFT_625878 [Corynespora cassiicola Philippines]